MRAAAAALLCLLAASPVAADSRTDLAKADLAAAMHVEPSAIIDVQPFALDTKPYVRGVVGRFKRGELVIGGAALVWCDRTDKCWYASVYLRHADEVEVLGLIDLRGAPAPFPQHRIDIRYHHGRLTRTRAKWPALLVRTTTREQKTSSSRYGGKPVTGTHRRSELVVISLARADVRNPAVLRATVDERWPTGSGQTTTFALEKGGALVATEQRHLENISMCIRPKPTTTRYTFDKQTRRFVEGGLPERTGCR